MISTRISSRLPALDILRAIAIILVFATHYPYFVDVPFLNFFHEIGWVGVDLFFVLSGYLIGNSLFSTIIQKQPFSFKLFYCRRFLRTLPNYYFVLALYFLIPSFSERPIIMPLWQFLTFTQNFDLLWSGFSQSWSLCVEEHFYLIFPILVFYFCQKRSLQKSWQFIILLFLFEIILRAILWFVYVEYAGDKFYVEFFNRIYYPTYTRLDGLLAGVSIALLKNFHPQQWEKLSRKGNALFFLGIIMTFITFILVEKQGEFFQATIGYTLLAFSFSLLTISALSPHAWWYNFQFPGVTILAVWSYAIYLTHKPVIAFMQPLYNAHIPYAWSATLFLTILGCLIAGGLLYYLVETPFMRWREVLTKKMLR